MKYSVILLCLALSVPMVSMAQGEVGSFSVMPKVGVCLANISGAEIVYTGETGDSTDPYGDGTGIEGDGA